MGPIGFSFLVIWNWAVKVWSLRWQWSSLNSPMRWLKLVKSREKLPANRSYAERSWVAQVSWSTSRSKGAEWLVERQEWETTGVCGWRGGYCSLDTWFPLPASICPGWVCFLHFSSVQSLSRVQLFATPWTAACQTSLSITNSWSLLKLMSINSVMPSNHLILCHPLLLHSIFPSIRVFSNDSVLCIRWPKYWSFSFSISPSYEYLGLISFGIDRMDLLAVQGTLKSLLQYHSSKASILWHSAFFMVQLSHPYTTTGKTIALTRWTFVGKVMSLLLNILSRLVIAFLPRSKHLLFSWLQSPSAVILEPPKNKVWHCFHCFPIYFPWSGGTRCHDLRFLNVEL